MSIKLKIILSFCIFCVLLSGSLSFYIYYYYSDYREELFENRLFLKSKQITNLYAASGNLEQLEKFIFTGDILNLYDEQVYLLDEAYKLIYTNTENDTLEPIIKQVKLAQGQYNEQMFIADSVRETIIYSFPVKDKCYFIVNSAIDLLGKEKLRNLTSILILGNVFAFFLSLLFGILFADYVIVPLQKIINQVNNISGTDFDKRIIGGNGKDEISQLAMNFNHMLERMQEVYQGQKQFISHASHELRTPLASVLSNLETTLLYDKSIKTTKKQIDKSISQLKQCIELTNGLLQLAYVNKELQLGFESIRLEELTLEEIALLKQKYPKQKIGFEIRNVDENDTTPFEIYGNKNLVGTAIKNILDNACKYSNKKAINVILIKHTTECHLQVADKGIGIPKEDFPRLFDPLYRGSNTRKFQGFGIGLSLTKRIMSLHGGEVSIVSTLGEGTHISLSFPLVSTLEKV